MALGRHDIVQPTRPFGNATMNLLLALVVHHALLFGPVGLEFLAFPRDLELSGARTQCLMQEQALLSRI